MTGPQPLTNASVWKTADAISKCVIGASLCLVVFAYLPTLQFDYVTQDQWRAFRYSQDAGSPRDRAILCAKMLSVFYTQTGRPLVWMTECVEHAAVARIADFRRLRPINLGIVLVTTAYLGVVLSPFIGLGSGVVAASAIVVSPGYSFMYLQGLPAAMVLLSLILAAMSFRQHYKRHFGRSFCLFLVACLIYPAYAFAVIPLALIEFGFSLFGSLTDRLKHLASTIGFYFVGSLTYYATVKVMVSWFEATREPLQQLGTYEVAIQLTPALLLERLTKVALYFYSMPPLNFHMPSGAPVFLLGSFSLYLAWFATCGRPTRRVAIAKFALLFFALSAGVLLASVSPWLFSKMDSLSTRHLVPWYLFSSAVCAGLVSRVLVRPSQEASKWAPLAALAIVGLPAGFVQHRLSTLEVSVTGDEIRAIRGRLAEWVDHQGWINDRYLLVVLPTNTRPADIERRLNDTGYGNDNAVLASSQNPVSIPWMITALLREYVDHQKFPLVDCGIDQVCVSSVLQNPPGVTLGYTTGVRGIRSPISPFVINLSALTSRPVNPSMTLTAAPTIRASSTLDSYGPYGLMSSAQPGWHAQRNPTYPQTITIDFAESKDIRRVALLPQDDHSARMPKTIRIEFSEDSKSWMTAASADDICANDADKWHIVELANAVRSRFLRIEIIANCGDPNFLTLRGLRIE